MNFSPEQISMMTQLMQGLGQQFPAPSNDENSGTTPSGETTGADTTGAPPNSAAGGGSASDSNSGEYSHDLWNAYVVMFLENYVNHFPKLLLLLIR